MTKAHFLKILNQEGRSKPQKDTFNANWKATIENLQVGNKKISSSSFLKQYILAFCGDNVQSKDLFDFMKKPSRRYAQPPLCFYEKIIDNNKFKNIYIIASDRRNVVLDALINKYKYIIYEQHEFNYDFALLAHAYNLAISVSTFALSAVKFNDNLKNLWEYDICRISQKYHFLHHHLYKFNYKYKVHTMKPSDIYAHKMFRWDLSQSQSKLMLEDKCTYDFVLTKPN